MQRIGGTVRNNATKNLPNGTIMRFEAKKLRGFPRDGLSEIPDLSSYEGLCLAVISSVGDQTFMCGSAALIAPGIAITAKHVIEELQKKANWRDGNRRLKLIGATKGGLIIWTATRVAMLNDSDLAIVSVKLTSELPESGNLNICEVAVSPPNVGERVCLSGMKANATSFATSSEQVELTLNLYASVGNVTAVQETERISALLSSPCFEVAAGALDCMSGGPAFDQHGRVVGIISTSYDDGPSYVTLLWPFVHEPLVSEWPEGLTTVPLSLADRAKAGLAFIDGVDKVEKEIIPETGQIAVRLTP